MEVFLDLFLSLREIPLRFFRVVLLFDSSCLLLLNDTRGVAATAACLPIYLLKDILVASIVCGDGE